MVPFGCMLRSYGIDGPFLDDKKYDSPIIYIYIVLYSTHGDFPRYVEQPEGTY